MFLPEQSCKGTFMVVLKFIKQHLQELLRIFDPGFI